MIWVILRWLAILVMVLLGLAMIIFYYDPTGRCDEKAMGHLDSVLAHGSRDALAGVVCDSQVIWRRSRLNPK